VVPTPSAQDQQDLATAPVIETVGVIADHRVQAGEDVFTLVDGRTWVGRHDTYRVIMDWGGGPGNLMIVGSDTRGRFVALLGHLDRLPSGCHFSRTAGKEYGVFVELGGVLFLKDAEFTSIPGVRMGDPYPPGTQFCFADNGRLTGAYPP
jgi:hypothetical protein